LNAGPLPIFSLIRNFKEFLETTKLSGDAQKFRVILTRADHAAESFRRKRRTLQDAVSLALKSATEGKRNQDDITAINSLS
jgi:hypothetical protein